MGRSVSGGHTECCERVC